MLPIGTFVNVFAIIIGGTIGVLLHKNFPQKYQEILFQGLGLTSIFIGIQMALKGEDILAVVFSMTLGGIVGTFFDLEEKLNQFAEFIKNKLKFSDKKFTDGFVSASLLFCVGAMAVVGSINDGLVGDRSVLYTKSVLDGATAIVLASTYGIGVLFSAIPILIYQGSITILASFAQGIFSPLVVNQLSSVGGILIMGIGINILEIKKLRIINLLPALVVVTLLAIVMY